MSEQHHELKVTIDGIEKEFFPETIVYWNCEEVEDAGYDPDSGNSLTMTRTTSEEWKVDYADIHLANIKTALNELPDNAQIVINMWLDTEDEKPNIVSKPLPKNDACKFISSVVEDIAQDNGFDGE
jgi:hypothetical protein